MRHLLWLVPIVVAVAVLWWAGLKGLSVLVAVVCGLGGLTYFVVRARRPMPPRWEEQERERHDVDAEKYRY